VLLPVSAPVALVSALALLPTGLHARALAPSDPSSTAGVPEPEPEPMAEAQLAPAPEPEGDPLAGAAGLSPQEMVDGEAAAYRHFMAGQRAAEALDVDAAIESFREALRVLPDEPPYGPSRGSLALRLALAYAAKYGDTADPAFLAAQETVLNAHLARLREIRPSDPAARESLRASVQARLSELAAERERIATDHGATEEQLAKSLRGEYREDEGPAWAPASEDLRWYPRPDDPRPRARQTDEGETAPEEQIVVAPEPARRRGGGLVAAGSVALGAGVAGLAVMGVGLGRARAANDFDPTASPMQRLEQIERGRQGNAMTVVGALSGSVLLATGIALVAVGAKRMRERPRATALAPFATPTHAGIVLTGRF
jgi:hypothetical protein